MNIRYAKYRPLQPKPPLPSHIKPFWSPLCNSTTSSFLPGSTRVADTREIKCRIRIRAFRKGHIRPEISKFKIPLKIELCFHMYRPKI